MKFPKIINSKKFKLESKGTPKNHETNLNKIQAQSSKFVLMNNPIINSNKRHERHIPQKILGCHYFIKGNKDPGLHDHSKKQIIMK